ncbi:uncharacterized protein LOC143297640 [Babylonia areolata]|uniref:uncharacterized protein LOC143297640 n=1 Tax=Babylonia areolata TaxID=304850 RepID=UPI003FCF4290
MLQMMHDMGLVPSDPKPVPPEGLILARMQFETGADGPTHDRRPIRKLKNLLDLAAARPNDSVAQIMLLSPAVRNARLPKPPPMKRLKPLENRPPRSRPRRREKSRRHGGL